MTGHAFTPGTHVGTLLSSTETTWNAAVGHRFVQELFAGTLDDTVLAHYLVQDYQFFDAFISMLGACIAHSDSLDAKLRFAQQLGFLAADEDGYFVQAFRELGVKPETYLNPSLHPVTREFRDLMYSAVESADYAQLLVMLVIAEGLYLDWGSLNLLTPDRYVHREWIDLHRGDAFADWAQFLVDELNRVCDAGADVAALGERWTRAVELELAFFDLGYELAGTEG